MKKYNDIIWLQLPDSDKGIGFADKIAVFLRPEHQTRYKQQARTWKNGTVCKSFVSIIDEITIMERDRVK